MSRDTIIGFGLTILIAVLQWRIKEMPHGITAAGIVFAIGLMAWPYLPIEARYNSPAFLGIIILALAAGTVVWAVSITQTPLAAPQVAAGDAVPPPLYEAQLEQLRGIDTFIARKDENSLRETF